MTTLAAAPDPLWELALSLHHLQLPLPTPFLSRWKRATLVKHGRDLRGELALLFTLNPPRGYFPDFLTPWESSDGLAAGVEALLATPKRRLATEIGQLDAGRAPAAVAAIGRGELGALLELKASLYSYFNQVLNPIWPRVVDAFDADRAMRSALFLGGGIARVLNSLHPSARYADGVLELGAWGGAGERDLHLGGRGLRLVPSYFKETRQLMLLADADLRPVLLYPLDAAARVKGDGRHESLAHLLGRSRALALEAAEGLTTSEVAARCGLTPSAASKHLAVLRASGLTTSTRDHNAVLHVRTSLGNALLFAS